MRSSYRGTKDFLSLGTRYRQQQVTLPSNLPSRTIRRALSLTPGQRGSPANRNGISKSKALGGHEAWTESRQVCGTLGFPWTYKAFKTQPSQSCVHTLQPNPPNLLRTPPFPGETSLLFSAFKQTHGEMENCQSLSCGTTRLEKENVQITHKHTGVHMH